MKLMTEEITPEFIERMTDRVIARLTDKLDELDISLDFIGAVLANTDAAALAGHQRKQGRLHVHRPIDGSDSPDKV
tara:strand:- start:7848 stop:8075 length:228 start_codon:yes stop_codon:yes gene_type:complete